MVHNDYNDSAGNNDNKVTVLLTQPAYLCNRAQFGPAQFCASIPLETLQFIFSFTSFAIDLIDVHE